MISKTISNSGEGRSLLIESNHRNDDDAHVVENADAFADTDAGNQLNTIDNKACKMFVLEKLDPNWKSYLEAEHRLFLNEIKQIYIETSKSLDLSANLIGRSGCSFCDSRHRIATSVPIHSDLKLKQHVQFIAESACNPAHFEYSRIWTGAFQHLPSGKLETKVRCEKLFQRLNSFGNACARESTYRMQSLYAKRKILWASPFDLSQRHTFIPSLAVLKTGSSSAVRLCLAPTTLYESPFGLISYNQCIAPLPLSQPKLLKFQLMHLLTTQLFTGDLAQMFTSVRLSYDSSLHSLSFAYRTADDWPTLCYDDSMDKQLHVIRNTALGFGTREAPKISKYCLTRATSVYKKANTLTPEEDLLCDMVGNVLESDTFADDLLGSISMSRLTQWCLVTNQPLPSPPTSQKKCVWFDTCINPSLCWSEEKLQQYRSQINFLSEQLLQRLASSLIKVLNYSSFELKYLKGSKRSQECLNSLVKTQCLNYPPTKLQVNRPSQIELNQHIAKLTNQITSPESQSPPEGSSSDCIEHLGHTYNSDHTVQLKSTSISIIYTSDNRHRRSVDFFCFQDFLDFNTKVKPIFTKRSIFSILAKNCCVTGNFLVLFKSQLKIVIRMYIRKNRKASWNSELDKETIRKMFICIETYFILVNKKINQPLTFKYQTNELFIAGISDGSENLKTYSISLIGRSCLGNIVRSEMVHLSLQSYSNHCDLINIVDVEYLAFLLLIQAMETILNELQKIGINVPDDNRLAFCDSRVVLTLLRSRVDLLKKRQSYLTAKAQILLNDIGMTPFHSVGYISQHEANHYPDIFSKFTFNGNLKEIESKYNKLMDNTWLCSSHPRKLKGIYFDTAYPSGTEYQALRSAVLESEWSEFEKSCKKETHKSIITAANKVNQLNITNNTQYIKPSFCHPNCPGDGSLEKVESESWEISNIENDSVTYDIEHSENPKNLKSVIPSVGHSEIDQTSNGVTPMVRVSENNQIEHSETPQILGSVISDVRHSENDSVTYDIEHSENPKNLKSVISSVGHSEIDQTLNSVTPMVRLSENNQIIDGTLNNGCSNNSSDKQYTCATQVSSNARKRSSIWVSEDRASWKKQIDTLLERKSSFALGSGSALKILTFCLEFGRKTKEAARCGPEGRVLRQKSRHASAQLKQVEVPEEIRPLGILADIHDQPRPAVHLLRSRLGDYEDLVMESQKPISSSPETSTRKVFHQLCTLYSTSQKVKGMTQVRYHNLNGEGVMILEGRRQRGYHDRTVRIPRFRPIDPSSPFADILIKAAHHFSKGKNLNQAILGLLNLSVHISGQTQLLQRLQLECNSCRRRRAQQGRKNDTVKLTKLGPTDFMNRAMNWKTGQSSTIVDILGPLRAFSNYQDSEQIKIFAALFIQLPLKTVTILPLQSYSSAHLLQAIKTYVNLTLRPVQLWASDAGSNLSRFSTQNPGYEDCEVEETLKVKTWRELATGERGRDLKTLGVHVKICAKDHKVVSQVEQAIFSTKKVLYSFNKSTQSPLTFFDWMYLFSEVSACIASRPICSTAEGRLYSAVSILSAMEKAGSFMGEDQIYVHKTGKDKVSAQLDLMAQHMQELRETISDLLLVLMVKPSFLDIQVRREQIKIRDNENDVDIHDVFFDPHLYKKTNNVTGSLIRLHQWGKSRQIGVFQKVGRLKPSSFLTRPIDQLYLVAKHNTTKIFGSKEWIPTWGFMQHTESDRNCLAPYLTWEPQNEAKILHPSDPEVQNECGEEELDSGEYEEEEVENECELQGGTSELGLETSDEEEKSTEQFEATTRSGRVVKRPQRYQS